MKAITATIQTNGQYAVFFPSYEVRGKLEGSSNIYRFGGDFMTPPVAVAGQDVRRPVRASTDVLGGADAGTSTGEVGAGLRAEGTIGFEMGRESGALHRERPTGDSILDTIVPRMDLFVLGYDYAIHAKRLWGTVDRDDLGPWISLGGNFVSAPAAISIGKRVHLFAVGEDHTLFTNTCIEGSWGNWESIGGSFNSTPCVIARKPGMIEVFVRHADFSLRTIRKVDGEDWAEWQNLGEELASAPVVVSWGPERLDVFAVFRNGKVHHRWWDGELWNEWETLERNESPGEKPIHYVGEPAAIATGEGKMEVFAVGTDGYLYHHRFENRTWAKGVKIGMLDDEKLASTPTVISPAPGRIELFVPLREGRKLFIYTRNDETWSWRSGGTSILIPQRYRFSVDYVHVDTTRALYSDTDAASVTLSFGNVPSQSKAQWIGSIGGATEVKTSQTNLLVVEGIIDLAEPMSFSYLVVNNGHGEEDKILNALRTAGDALAISGSSSMREDIVKKVVSFALIRLTDAATAATIEIPVVGSIVQVAGPWLRDKLQSVIFEPCDGIVAAGLLANMGRDLHKLTNHGRDKKTWKTRHAGTDADGICGSPSDYTVTWTIAPF
jgi:hypothetical protein